VGLEGTDAFIRCLKELSGNEVPEQLALERGWLLDAMVDSHKHNAEARPAIFGEPETVCAVASLCAENGAWPKVLACGAQSSDISSTIGTIMSNAEAFTFIGEADFRSIAEACAHQEVNIAIGHSGGKVLTERWDIPLVRVGFPINDRVGGQRVLSAGYSGSISLLDKITNALLESKLTTYRQRKKEELSMIGAI